jgi:hypothetical protein
LKIQQQATFLSSQLILDSIANRSNYPLPQPIPTVPRRGEM